MATLKLTIFKAKVLKDGKHKIRVAVCHKTETSYIVTNVIIDNESQFKNGQIVKRPDASLLNTKLRNLLNEYQEKLDSIKNQSLYSSSQLKNILVRGNAIKENSSFQSVCNGYEEELRENGSYKYAEMLERNKQFTPKRSPKSLQLTGRVSISFNKDANSCVIRLLSATSFQLRLT